MPVHIYHPNKVSSGFACSFSDGLNGDCMFASILKQSGWNESTRTGTFKASLDDKNSFANIKLSDLEVAAILDCVERGRPFSTYHDGDVPKTIQFTPWFSKQVNEDTNKPDQRGFSFAITVSSKEDPTIKNSFYIGLNFAEARLIREYLLNSLNSHFNIDKVTTLANAKNRQNKQVIEIEANNSSEELV